MAGCMARSMENPKILPADADNVTLIEPTVGFETLNLWETEHLTLLRQGIDPETVLFLRPFYRYTRATRQLDSTTSMIDMPMG